MIKPSGMPDAYTHTGAEVWFEEPCFTPIRWADLAFGLSHVFRYCGQQPVPLLGHSILVGRLAEDAKLPSPAVLYAYLHDVHEVIVGDVHPRLKTLMPGFRELEDRWQLHFLTELGCPLPDPTTKTLVKVLDIRAKVLEMKMVGHAALQRAADWKQPPPRVTAEEMEICLNAYRDSEVVLRQALIRHGLPAPAR